LEERVGERRPITIFDDVARGDIPVAALIDLVGWLRMTTSSPPEEERETARRPMSTKTRVRRSEDWRTP
jgi:hypothetical protein